MPLYIVDLLLDNIYMVDQAAAERMRMICWASVAPHSKKNLRPEDMFKFSWEKAVTERDTTPMTRERMEALQAQAQQIRQKIMSDKQNG